MADICPDNSTECLIRALLNEQISDHNEYNWDPVTFGFTVAIGVLAYLVAWVTVFQGVLSAGQGRLKANRRAIGDFSRFSKRNIAWSEFRIRTTARVPFINIPSLQRGYLDQSGRDWVFMVEKLLKAYKLLDHVSDQMADEASRNGRLQFTDFEIEAVLKDDAAVAAIEYSLNAAGGAVVATPPFIPDVAATSPVHAGDSVVHAGPIQVGTSVPLGLPENSAHVAFDYGQVVHAGPVRMGASVSLGLPENSVPLGIGYGQVSLPTKTHSAVITSRFEVTTTRKTRIPLLNITWTRQVGSTVSGSDKAEVGLSVEPMLNSSSSAVAPGTAAGADVLLNFDESARPGPKLSALAKSKGTEHITKADVTPEINKFAAGWTNLLAELPCSPYHFLVNFRSIASGSTTNFVAQAGSQEALLLRDTECVPSELFAVPAVGTMESLMTIAAFAGCDEVTRPRQDGDFPLMRGNNMQLSFRDDPQLGTVAVFQMLPLLPTYDLRYPISASLQHCDLPPGVMINLEMSGWLWKDKHQSPSPGDAKHNPLVIAILCFASIGWPRAFPYEELKIEALAKRACETSPAWKDDTNLDKILKALNEHARSRGNRTYKTELEKWPKDRGFEPFPERPRFDCLSIFYHKGQRWEFRIRELFLVSPVRFTSSVSVMGHTLATEEYHGTFQHVIFPGRSLEVPLYELKRSDLIVVPTALRLCLRFLSRTDSLDMKKLSSDERGWVRGAMRYQLHEIDVYLAHLADGKPEIFARKIENILIDLFEAKTRPRWDDEDHEGLDAVIVFRIVVVAVLLRTAADISCVAGTELGKTIVQCL